MIYRTFFGDVGCDISLPKENNKKLVIICPGLPSDPSNYEIMDFLSDNGFLSIYVRYSGTWGSYGTFLKNSPVNDIIGIIDTISKNKFFVDSSNSKNVLLDFKEIILLGTSFGGSIALVCGAKSKFVKKIIALSPIVDYKDHAKNSNYFEESINTLGDYLKRAYGKTYDFTKDSWKNFIAGGLDLNPVDYIDKLNKKEVVILSGMEDKTISVKRVEKFFEKIPSKKKEHHLLKNFGHLSLRKIDKKFLRELLVN